MEYNEGSSVEEEVEEEEGEELVKIEPGHQSIRLPYRRDEDQLLAPVERHHRLPLVLLVTSAVCSI